jgi:hypothetical protein
MIPSSENIFFSNFVIYCLFFDRAIIYNLIFIFLFLEPLVINYYSSTITDSDYINQLRN